MTEPFLGQTILAAFDFPPKGYAACNGSLLPINQNQALFALLGTTYGGNGQTTFALPDLRGRTPIHVSGGHVQGDAVGQALHPRLAGLRLFNRAQDLADGRFAAQRRGLDRDQSLAYHAAGRHHLQE